MDLWLAKLGDSTNLTLQAPILSVDDWKIFPNPSQESFTISSNQFSKGTKISVYNILGCPVNSVVSNVKNNSKLLTINSSPGLYFIEVIDGKERMLYKVIKQ